MNTAFGTAGMAFRNLGRQKRRNLLLAGAFAFAATIIVAVNGIAGGLSASVLENVSSLVTGQIFYTSVRKDADGRLVQLIDDDGRMLEVAARADIGAEAATRRTAWGSTVVYNGESIGRQLYGIDWNDETKLAGSLRFDAGSAEGMAGSDGIVISGKLAETLGLVPKGKLDAAERDALRRRILLDLKAEGVVGKDRARRLERSLKDEVARQEAARKASRDESLRRAIGETVIVQLSTVHGQQNVGEFRVRGIYAAEFDFTVYVDRGVLNGLLDLPESSYNMFGLSLADPGDLARKTAAFHAALASAGYDLYPYEKSKGRTGNDVYQELQRTEFEGAKGIVGNIEDELGSFMAIATGVRAASTGLFVVILAVIMVGLSNTFRMIVYERTKEIGTMRALGASRSAVRNVVLLEAVLLAAAGTAVGFAAGFLLLGAARLVRFEAFTELAFFLDDGRLAYAVEPGLLATALAAVLVMTLFAVLGPARKAARMNPADALRAQF